MEEEIGRMIRVKKRECSRKMVLHCLLCMSPAVAMMNWPVSKSSDDGQQNKVCRICRKEAAEASHQPRDVVSLNFNEWL